MLRRVTVFEYERALEYRAGRLVRLLGPGRYWLLGGGRTVRTIDIRPLFLTVPGQEVLSADGVTLRVSMAAEVAVADPVKAVNDVPSWHDALYLTLQLALRELVGANEIDDLLGRRDQIGGELLARTSAKAAQLGLALTRVDLKDIMFPGELKKTFAQVVAARKEGQAALEKARGETAALRSLANAARLAEASPALLQLRLLQQLSSSSGNTVVVGFPSQSTPLPLRAPDAPTAGEQIPPAPDDAA